MEERVEERRPGAAHVVVVLDDLVRVEDRDRAEEMLWKFLEKDPLHPVLGGEASVAAMHDDDAVRPGGRQAVHRLDRGALERFFLDVKVHPRFAIADDRL